MSTVGYFRGDAAALAGNGPMIIVTSATRAALSQGCRVANGLPMASGTLERYRAVGSGFGGRQMPLRDAGYRRTTLDAG